MPTKNLWCSGREERGALSLVFPASFDFAQDRLYRPAALLRGLTRRPCHVSLRDLSRPDGTGFERIRGRHEP